MDGALPSGVVTFVLTDVVGSTRLWQEAAEAMDAAICRQVEIVTAAVTARGGTVIKPRGEGDSMFCVFAKATDAIGAAHFAQTALLSESWPGDVRLSVRLAVHTGEAVERDGDYFGPVVNRAARIRSIAAGGEVLVSGTTSALVIDALPAGCRLVELGDVQLQDLDRVERVYVLDAPGLEASPRFGTSLGATPGRRHVEVRLLGAVDALVDGEPVDIGGPKERTVLALLALSGGPLSLERLIDGVWEDRAPPSARKTLQTYIWRLRRVLGDDVVASVTAGYLLRVGSDTDQARFERLAREGGDCLQGGDAGQAALVFAEALLLWRGEPLAGCGPSPVLAAERTRLLEVHATVVDGRLQAELQLGHHAEVLGELESVVQADPFREERWRLLVLALYRSGRQRDALRCYQRARRTLIEGLGVEPGPALRDLEQAILEQSDDLLLPPPTTAAHAGNPAGTAGSRAIPVPIPPTPVVGRTSERAFLWSLLDDHRLVTLTGAGGAGKTRLAVAVALENDGDACLCDLSLLSRDGSVLHAFARAIGQPLDPLGSRTEEQALQLLVDALRDRELLVVVDNCEHVLDACATVLGRVLAECPGIGLLATSREPLGVPGERVVPLAPLEVPVDADDVSASAVVLFEQRGAAARTGFAVSASNRRAVVDICRRLEGLPLAIELAAARLSHLTPDEVAARLERPFDLLGSRRRTGPDRHRTLHAALDWSHDLLGPAEQQLFRRLAVFAGNFSLTDVEGCCGTVFDGAPVVDIVGALVDCSLLSVDTSAPVARYRMLETIRAYAREHLTTSAEEDDVRAAHCAWYLGEIERIPWGHRALALATRETLAVIQEDLREAITWAEGAGRIDLVARLVASMISVWKEGHFNEADRWFPVAVEYESTLPPDQRTATALASLMYLFHWDGDQESLRRHRLRLAALAENLPSDAPVTSLAYATLASLCSRLDGEEAAWEAYADLAVRHAPPDSAPIVAMARCQKARALMFRDEPERAVDVLDDAIAVLGADADSFEFSPQEDLALAWHLLGHHERTLAIAEARLARETRFPRWYVAIYAALACAALGDPAGARHHARSAAERARALTMPLVANDCRVVVGGIAFLEGRPAVAADLLAALTTGSASYNTLGVLLRHYQQRTHAALSAGRWDRARSLTSEDAWRVVEAELQRDA